MRRIPQLLLYTPLVALIDLLLIQVSFFAMFFLKWGRFGMATPNFQGYVQVIPWICLSSLVVFYLCHLYTNWQSHGKEQLLYFVFVSALLNCLTTMALPFWEQEFSFTRSVVVGGAVMQFVLLASYRLLLRSVYWSTVGRRRVMVIACDEEQAIATIRKLEPKAPGWMQFVGSLVGDDVEDLERRAFQFDMILLTARHPEQRGLIKRCARLGKAVMLVPAAMEMSLLGASSVTIDDVLIFTLHTPQLSPGQILIKRAFDLVVCVTLLVVACPIILLTGIVIRLTSEGPVIFRQERVGKNGVEYTLYKFRTMIAGAEKLTGPVLARESDPRITKLGGFLRATRIDELPQLFNVLIGNMSMIGPRPERGFFVNKFKNTVSGYDFRLAVKPGITGLAQVAGGYSTTVERKLRFDLLYIYDYSLVLDFRILLRTVLVVLHKEQAAGVKVSPRSVIASGRENKIWTAAASGANVRKVWPPSATEQAALRAVSSVLVGGRGQAGAGLREYPRQ